MKPRSQARPSGTRRWSRGAALCEAMRERQLVNIRHLSYSPNEKEDPPLSELDMMRILWLSLISTILTAQATWAQSAADYRQRGIQYRSQEQFPQAIESFQKAVELDQKNLAGRIGLGWTLHLANRRAEAIDMLQSTIPYNPYNIETFNALGIAYLVNGDLVQAVAAHTWATMLNPNHEIPYYNLSLAYERLAMYDWAVECAKRAAELEPNNPHPWVALAMAYQGQGDVTSAKQIYLQAMNMDGRYRDRDFLKFLSEAGFSADQITRAQQMLKLATTDAAT